MLFLSNVFLIIRPHSLSSLSEMPGAFSIHSSISPRTKTSLPPGFQKGILRRNTRLRIAAGERLNKSAHSTVFRYLLEPGYLVIIE